MVRNKDKYEQVIGLRKRGFTLTEIAKYCDISKSTASEWLKNKDFSIQITKKNKKRSGLDNAKRLQLINKTKVGERMNQYKEAERSAEIEFKHYKKSNLFIAGLMLYTGSGDLKDDKSIRLSSTKIPIHAIFINFIIEFMGLNRNEIHFWITLYPDHNEEQCMKKWKKSTSLPYSQFYKNQVIQGKSNKKILHYGIGNTIINSTILKCKLNRWIELSIKELAKSK